MIEPPILAIVAWTGLPVVAVVIRPRRSRTLARPFIAPLGWSPTLALLLIVVSIPVIHAPARLIVGRPLRIPAVIRTSLLARLKRTLIGTVAIALEPALVRPARREALIVPWRPLPLESRLVRATWREAPVVSRRSLAITPLESRLVRAARREVPVVSRRSLAVASLESPLIRAMRHGLLIARRGTRPAIAIEPAVFALKRRSRVPLGPALVTRIAAIRFAILELPGLLLLVREEIALWVEAALATLLLRLPIAAWRLSRPAIAIAGALLARAGRSRRHLPALNRARATCSRLRPLSLDRDLGVATLGRILFGQLHVHRFEERLLLAGGEIAPEPERHARHHQRPDANARQAINHDSGSIHHPANDVIHPFVQ